MFASPLSSVRDPVKSFCLCVKVRMQGSGLVFFSVSTKGDRCFAALFYCTFGLLLRHSVLDPHSSALALEVQQDLCEVLNTDSKVIWSRCDSVRGLRGDADASRSRSLPCLSHFHLPAHVW